jgi:hypothetical protein
MLRSFLQLKEPLFGVDNSNGVDIILSAIT